MYIYIYICRLNCQKLQLQRGQRKQKMLALVACSMLGCFKGNTRRMAPSLPSLVKMAKVDVDLGRTVGPWSLCLSWAVCNLFGGRSRRPCRDQTAMQAHQLLLGLILFRQCLCRKRRILQIFTHITIAKLVKLTVSLTNEAALLTIFLKSLQFVKLGSCFVVQLGSCSEDLIPSRFYLSNEEVAQTKALCIALSGLPGLSSA